jgi:uncharacterized protein YjiS (DUF1127 family)
MRHAIETNTVLRRWWRAFVDWRYRLRSMGELQSMSDRELKDMGLYRSEIYWVTHNGRYEPPIGRSTNGSVVPLSPLPVEPRPARPTTQPVTDGKRAA